MKKERTYEKEMADTSAEISSGSVYEQLGYKDHREMETKANLVVEINSAIKNKRITQTEAAEILGLSQPKLSELLNGRFRWFSVERLINLLNELGKDMDIVVKTKPRNRKEGRVSVYHSGGGVESPAVSIAAKGRH